MSAEPIPTYRKLAPPTTKPRSDSSHIVQAMYEQPYLTIETGLKDFALLPPGEAMDMIEVTDREHLDRRWLGAQKWGTLGAEVNYRRRIAIEEFPFGPSADAFTEVKLWRRLRQQWTNTYSRSELMLRPRADSSFSWGLTQRGTTTLDHNDADDAAREVGWDALGMSWQGTYYQHFGARRFADTVSNNPFSVGASVTLWEETVASAQLESSR